MSPQEKFITDLISPYYMGEWEFSTDENGACLYNGPNGRMCAFSRCVVEPHLLPERETAYVIMTQEPKERPQLKKEASEMNFSPKDWLNIQGLHDNEGSLRDLLADLGGLQKYGPFTKLKAVITKYKNDNE